jgi:2-phospho-L-lactate guanylyltransferase
MANQAPGPQDESNEAPESSGVQVSDQESSGLIVIIPMKPLSDSKSRLSRKFSKEDREDLSLGLLRRVIGVVNAASVGAFWVVGGDTRVRNATRNAGGIWLEEMGRNLNDTLGKAFDRAAERGNSAMYLASDLPFIKPIDVHSVLQASRQQNNISLAPARRDGGTNAILVPHGIPFRPELGGKSFIRHLSQAASIGISVAICYSPGLGFDLDTPDDLESYEHMEPGLLERLVPRRSPPGNG